VSGRTKASTLPGHCPPNFRRSIGAQQSLTHTLERLHRFDHIEPVVLQRYQHPSYDSRIGYGQLIESRGRRKRDDESSADLLCRRRTPAILLVSPCGYTDTAFRLDDLWSLPLTTWTHDGSIRTIRITEILRLPGLVERGYDARYLASSRLFHLSLPVIRTRVRILGADRESRKAADQVADE
jgi:hypothetical protein